MKQNITPEQLIELSFEAGAILTKWARERGKPVGIDDDLRLSIGQMIEFLDDNGVDLLHALNCEVPAYDFSSEYIYEARDWCDALWEAVKEVLNNKEI